MKKFTKTLTNAVDNAKWNRVKHSHLPNQTKNGTISTQTFKRECVEYDAGILPFEHELYIGERCG